MVEGVLHSLLEDRLEISTINASFLPHESMQSAVWRVNLFAVSCGDIKAHEKNDKSSMISSNSIEALHLAVIVCSVWLFCFLWNKYNSTRWKPRTNKTEQQAKQARSDQAHPFDLFITANLM